MDARRMTKERHAYASHEQSWNEALTVLALNRHLFLLVASSFFDKVIQDHK